LKIESSVYSETSVTNTHHHDITSWKAVIFNNTYYFYSVDIWFLCPLYWASPCIYADECCNNISNRTSHKKRYHLPTLFLIVALTHWCWVSTVKTYRNTHQPR